MSTHRNTPTNAPLPGFRGAAHLAGNTQPGTPTVNQTHDDA